MRLKFFSPFHHGLHFLVLSIRGWSCNQLHIKSISSSTKSLLHTNQPSVASVIHLKPYQLVSG